ncbi:transcription factor BHLH42 [Lactuca sativa]|uniref:transcription factor BHLH42 n=1 Tax=Lactuca sativa TaxID=4236 RepID=UPI001C694015|nr:transcription factor BHLH42 [Lactuca sativa]
MAVALAQPYDGLKTMLQSAVQSVQWTYIIFWQLCPQQRVLVWGDGYYNGAIKTRKTVQSVEVSTEEAALCRSEQLRELYDSLVAGEQQATENQQPTIRRPAVALLPEDLTEAEWFYLVCVSFSFPPGVGLVGEAYAKQQHLWLTGANEVDSTVFTRAILAKSADIQTVVCIPLLNGVVELGTTEKVEEGIDLIEHVKHFFKVENDKSIIPRPRPALSAHSSNTNTLSTRQFKPLNNRYLMDAYADDDNEDEEDDDDDDEEEEENESDFEAETDHISIVEEPHDEDSIVMEANELLQLDMSTDIRFGSSIDDSINLDSHFDHLLPTSQDHDSCRADSHPHALELHNPSTIHLQGSQDSHYSRTVSTILHKQTSQLSQWHDSHSASRHNSLYTSTQSSFTAWVSNHHHHTVAETRSNSQSLLKYIIFTVPFLHSNNNNNNNKSTEGDASESVASRIRKTTSHEELSANHVLAERRRREKLNERFMVLRSLVPLVTKMDKASILGDTIEYVKQLRKKIQDLEARDHRQDTLDTSKRKIQVVDTGSIGGGRKAARSVQVEVSIIESDALVELQCPHREGLLLDVMKKLRELGVEITTVQSCMNEGTCTAEMRAKVKVNGNNGKKISIMQVKKAINKIISPLLLTQ